MKSTWKVFKISKPFLRQSYKQKMLEAINQKNDEKKPLVFMFKNFHVFNKLEGCIGQFYNGVKFLQFTMRKGMVGMHVGSFVLTKRITRDIHVKSSQTKGKKTFTKKK